MSRRKPWWEDKGDRWDKYWLPGGDRRGGSGKSVGFIKAGKGCLGLITQLTLSLYLWIVVVSMLFMEIIVFFLGENSLFSITPLTL